MVKSKMERLYDACFKSDWQLVQTLMDSGVSVRFRHPKNGLPTLYVAVARKAPIEIIKQIVEVGKANVSEGDKRGFTPLHAACEYGSSIDVVKYLLDAGANPNQSSEDGATPLHFAAQYTVKKQVLQALLSAGANVNAMKLNGATPLYSAIENGASASFVRALIEVGADTRTKLYNPRTREYETPLTVAQRNCSADVVAILEERKDKPKRSSKSLSSSKHLADKIEKARLLFRYLVTSNSQLTILETRQVNGESDDGIIPVDAGEKVTLIHGSLEEGLHSPFEDFVLAMTQDGKTGKIHRSNLYDHASYQQPQV